MEENCVKLEILWKMTKVQPMQIHATDSKFNENRHLNVILTVVSLTPSLLFMNEYDNTNVQHTQTQHLNQHSTHLWNDARPFWLHTWMNIRIFQSIDYSSLS